MVVRSGRHDSYLHLTTCLTTIMKYATIRARGDVT